jgi:RNA polymerase sigma-70 factor, ECF subfamily
VEDANSRSRISALLSESTAGGRDTFDEVFPLVYEELREMARRQLGAQWGKCTLNTTGLVHEAYLKLVNESQVPARGRAYFFGAAASAMRRVLVDAARRRNSIKRGGGKDDVTLDESLMAADGFAVDVMALDEALTRFSEHYPRQAEVVECRFFGGLSIEDTAAALDLSRRSVIRDWAMARAWLFRELEMEPVGG